MAGFIVPQGNPDMELKGILTKVPVSVHEQLMIISESNGIAMNTLVNEMIVHCLRDVEVPEDGNIQSVEDIPDDE
jgi:hypothetical protein